MIQRLLTFLLLACLAVPAMAARPHCEGQVSQAMAMAQDHAHHRRQAPPHKAPDMAPASHDCIGCIAPLAGLGPVSEPGPLPITVPVSREKRLSVRQTTGPDTPPPRA